MVTLLSIIAGERCLVNGATQRAFDLKQSIEDVIIEKGWEVYL